MCLDVIGIVSSFSRCQQLRRRQRRRQLASTTAPITNFVVAAAARRLRSGGKKLRALDDRANADRIEPNRGHITRQQTREPRSAQLRSDGRPFCNSRSGVRVWRACASCWAGRLAGGVVDVVAVVGLAHLRTLTHTYGQAENWCLAHTHDHATRIAFRADPSVSQALAQSLLSRHQRRAAVESTAHEMC